MKSRADQLAADIEAEEKKIFGGNPDEAEAQAPAPRANDDDVQGQADDSAADVRAAIGRKPEDLTDDSAAAKDAQKPQSDWEERFKSFKQMADATIHGLRQEKLLLQEDVQSLKVQMAELAGKISEAQDKKLDITSLFSEEERNLIGEETIKGIEKAVLTTLDSTVNPLKTQLEKERQEREKAEARQVQNARAQSDKEFIDKLNAMVPDLMKIDRDPKFIQWMAGPDTASGVPRERLFKVAQRAGDVHRVAGFFLEYAKLTAPKKDEKMEKKITPSNQAAAPKTSDENKKPRMLTMKQIDQFYDDVVRGKYRHKPKEQDRMEKLIDATLRKTGLGRKF